MFAYTCGIDQIFFLTKTKFEFKKKMGQMHEIRLKTVIYIRQSAKNSVQSQKVIHESQRMIKNFSRSEKISSHGNFSHFRF